MEQDTMNLAWVGEEFQRNRLRNQTRRLTRKGKKVKEQNSQNVKTDLKAFW